MRPVDAGEQPALVGDVLAVIGKEAFIQRLQPFRGERLAGGGKTALDQSPRTQSDHGADFIEADGPPALGGKDRIGRRRQVGRGVDQRPVEIEDQALEGRL